jgi:hypothetical protein
MRATFAGTIISRPIRGRSPKGKRLVTAILETDDGEHIRIVGFCAGRDELLELQIGDRVEIFGRVENFAVTGSRKP